MVVVEEEVEEEEEEKEKSVRISKHHVCPGKNDGLECLGERCSLRTETQEKLFCQSATSGIVEEPSWSGGGGGERNIQHQLLLASHLGEGNSQF